MLPSTESNFDKAHPFAGSSHLTSAGISTKIGKLMKREHLEHLIRAAGAIADTDELVIIGSQAILGACPTAPAELLRSMEADIYPLADPSKADLIDGSIGEASPFHETFSYYAHGVGPTTAVLPADWQERAVIICNENTNGVRGLCPHPSDLAVSKLVAGRQRDMEFVQALLRHQIITAPDITKRIDALSPEHASLARERLSRCLSEATPEPRD